MLLTAAWAPHTGTSIWTGVHLLVLTTSTCMPLLLLPPAAGQDAVSCCPWHQAECTSCRLHASNFLLNGLTRTSWQHRDIHPLDGCNDAFELELAEPQSVTGKRERRSTRCRQSCQSPQKSYLAKRQLAPRSVQQCGSSPAAVWRHPSAFCWKAHWRLQRTQRRSSSMAGTQRFWVCTAATGQPCVSVWP